MLIQLLPEQISRMWDELRQGIESSLPPTTTEASMAMILSRLMNGDMQAWIAGTEDKGICAVCTTAYCYDPGTKDKSLLIYTLFGYKFISEEVYKDMIETLKTFARSKNCKEITAYTQVQRILDVAKDNAWDISWHYIKMEV